MNINILQSNQLDSIKCKQVFEKIYGVNSTISFNLLRYLGLDPTCKFKELSFEDKQKISRLITIKLKNCIDVDLKKFNYDNIKFLKKIRSYKGIRHTLSLTVNGQRTKTNAKTQKWKRKKK